MPAPMDIRCVAFPFLIMDLTFWNRESVKEYYGKILSSTSSLKTSACTASSKPHPIILAALRSVPQSVKEKYYGCGSAVPLGIEGLDLLELGSGSGQDCYVAASLVGPNGSVIGVDMTEEQLLVARDGLAAFASSLEYQPKLEFRQGLIEDLQGAGINSESLDVIISNCVVNLSPRKVRPNLHVECFEIVKTFLQDLVLKEAYRALRFGGEFFFSDVYCDRRLPDSVRKHEVLWGECIAGAMYTNDFLHLCRDVGFSDPRQMEVHPIAVEDPELLQVTGNAKFFSITFRLFKIAGLERLCEDYGQVAIYKGTIPGHPHSYILDHGHMFVTGKPSLVCGNSAAMVSESWLKKHFQVLGDRSTHFGEFDCRSGKTNQESSNSSKSMAANESGKGSCC